jgi:hypothetical protein
MAATEHHQAAAYLNDNVEKEFCYSCTFTAFLRDFGDYQGADELRGHKIRQ